MHFFEVVDNVDGVSVDFKTKCDGFSRAVGELFISLVLCVSSLSKAQCLLELVVELEQLELSIFRFTLDKSNPLSFLCSFSRSECLLE